MTSKYFADRQQQIKSAFEFQKERINERYREISEKSTNVTKKGEMSALEFYKMKEDEWQQRRDSKVRKSQYADILKSQMGTKERRDLRDALDETDNISMGRYKLCRNSSVPMVPGISSKSTLIPKNLQNANPDHFRRRSKNMLDELNAKSNYQLQHDGLPSSEELNGINKTRNRNTFEIFRSSVPNLNKKLDNDNSRNTLRMSGLSTLHSNTNEKLQTLKSNMAAGKQTNCLNQKSHTRTSNTFISTVPF
mmetsp:Transcript_10760/g.12093  ORF Transcript_10760/g.12093 Transcript_10760/m.12093 type:complete len:250 (-) Transcript_10760:16-765(-)